MNDRERVQSCCDGEADGLALDTVHENRPGLPSLSYRLGQHGDFLARMLARLPSQGVGASGAGPSGMPLSRLTYRGTDDPLIALLDACSMLLDVLSFYQERVANEGFIRTSLERRSVLELARSIGYELRPGVAASTLLSFSVEDAPGTPARVTVPRGTQMLSIPKKDELPQTFETIEELEARVEWNALRPRAPWVTLTQPVDTSTTTLFVAGGGSRLQPGDVLLLVDEVTGSDGATTQEVRGVRRIQAAAAFPDRGYTRLELQPPADAPDEPVALEAPRLFAFRVRARLFGQNAAEATQPFEARRGFAAGIQTPVTCVALAPAGASAVPLAASGFQAASPAPQTPDVRLHGTLRLWRVDAGRETHALEVYETITAVAFSSDGGYVAAADHAGGDVRLRVWDADTGAHVATGDLAGADIAQDGPIVAVIFQHAPDTGAGDITTVGQDGMAVVWRLDIDPGTGAGSLAPVEDIDLSALGDFTGDPRQARDGDRSLVGHDDGTSLYTAVEEPASIPDRITLHDGQVDLASAYPGLVPRSWALLTDPEQSAAYPVEQVAVVQRSDWGVWGRVTRLTLTLDQDGAPPEFSLQETDVYAASEEIALARLQVALPEPVHGDRIELAEAVPGLAPGRTVIVQGRPAGPVVAPPPAGGTSVQTVTAQVPGDRSISLDVHRETAAGGGEKPARFVDERGFVGVLDGETPAVVAWSDDEPITHEIARVESMNGTDAPVLRLAEPLRNTYDWRTVRILANVAPATHGETVTEVLGSGDGLQRNQRFTLRKPPLTHVPAATASGSQSTLEVRVNGVLWQEGGSLYMADPADETFMVRIQDDGKTEVVFGDGERGARLPSGAENVVARYRSGLGPEGEVDAGQISLLKTRPLGIREVTNPLPASGAAPPEHQSEARDNAPRTSLVLGRVVSIQDYEDFTRLFPGIGKAHAVTMWDGVARFVHLTVGTASGAPLKPGSVLHQSLLGALDAVRDTTQLVTIEGYAPRAFGVTARVLVDARYQPDPVLASIRQRLAAAFSYGARGFGQDVTAAEVVSTIHEVSGVIAVDLDNLYHADEPPDDGEDPCQDAWQDAGQGAPTQRLPARLADLYDGKPRAAELLLIDPDRICVKEMS